MDKALKSNYALVTSARNEESYIENLLNAVVSQTIQPSKWVIVSDGSTDRTDEIASKYSEDYAFIELVSLSSQDERDFASKVHAIKAGTAQLAGFDYAFIGILDADISFESTYYERIIAKCLENPRLGIAGGVLVDVVGEKLIDRFSSPWSVSGGIQFFRRECFEQIGGYFPLRLGGEDTIAEVMARMHGWQVESFREITGFHHRRTGTAEANIWKAQFSAGLRGYSIGSHPIFEVVKNVRRVAETPYLFGSVLRMAGFIWAYCSRERKMLPNEVIEFLRREQMKKLRSVFTRTA